jgi:phosphatidylglycerol:prolipoprotein diacylglycerol transferase
MITFGDNFLSIAGFKVYYYGILISIGAVSAVALAYREAKRRGLDQEFLLDVVPWIVFGGIVGARLWHIFTPPPSMVAQGITTKYYLTHPLDALNLRAGGLGIPGAIIGGLLLFIWYARRRGERISGWLDVFAPAIPLGQAIGRWGNFFNQELYGAPTDLPWGIFISPENRLDGFDAFSTYHPIFLYESIWNIGVMVLLLWLGRKQTESLKSGDLFIIYVGCYAAIRLLLDFLRMDASQIAGWNANQFVMAVILVAVGGYYLWRRTKTKPGSSTV